MQVVVGAAIVRDRRVLAARRSAPAALAGGWEFPGGKVKPGESEPDALRRECREELGIDVQVGDLLGRAPIADGVELAVYVGQPAPGEPEPRQDHDELRWLGASELDSVAWLDVDRVFLPAIGSLLARID